MNFWVGSGYCVCVVNTAGCDAISEDDEAMLNEEEEESGYYWLPEACTEKSGHASQSFTPPDWPGTTGA